MHFTGVTQDDQNFTDSTPGFAKSIVRDCRQTYATKEVFDHNHEFIPALPRLSSDDKLSRKIATMVSSNQRHNVYACHDTTMKHLDQERLEKIGNFEYLIGRYKLEQKTE